MEKNNKIMQFIGLDCILMILLTMVDQWTKSLVVHHLKGQSDVILIPGVFQLHYLENRGAAFGILQNQRAVFVVLTVIYLAAVFWFLRMERAFEQYLLAAAVGTPVEIDDATAHFTARQVGSHRAGWFAIQPLMDKVLAEQPELSE